MELFKSSELKIGNYYKVADQSMVIFLSNKKRHIHVNYYRYHFSIEYYSNQYLSDAPVYEIISKYSFFRIKRLIDNLINKTLQNGTKQV